jgi:hypothetical protein
MSNILDRVADSFGRFSPSKPTEYLALQVARKLGDIKAFRHYLGLFERYPEEVLLDAYQRCAGRGNLTGEHFMKTLRKVTQ